MDGTHLSCVNFGDGLLQVAFTQRDTDGLATQVQMENTYLKALNMVPM